MTTGSAVPETARRAAGRLVYLGTPGVAVAPLRGLVAAGFEVAAVVTRIDKRRGRGSELTASPVKAVALQLGLPVVHTVDEALAFGAELGIVVAFGELIKPHVLAALPMVNLHFSLLPRWRGAAPVERALLGGDAKSGVCLMGVEEGLDTGPIFGCVETAIEATDTGDALRARLAQIGTELLIHELTVGLGEPVAQVGEPTYAAKLTTDDRRLDWRLPAIDRHRLIRLGGAWTTFRDRRMKIISADLVDPIALGAEIDDGVVGGLRLLRVQPEGRGAIDWNDFTHGARLRRSERFR